MFALAYYFIADVGDVTGNIIARKAEGFAEQIYFSFSTYTSLGYGDLVPSEPLRFMAGMEALTGLLLIAWTASFMYLQMQRTWGHTVLRP